MKTKELLPCPFCGGEADKIFKGNDYTKKRSVTIKCTKCFTEQRTGAIQNNLEWCDASAIKRWNQRTQLSSLPDGRDLRSELIKFLTYFQTLWEAEKNKTNTEIIEEYFSQIKESSDKDTDHAITGN